MVVPWAIVVVLAATTVVRELLTWRRDALRRASMERLVIMAGPDSRIVDRQDGGGEIVVERRRSSFVVLGSVGLWSIQ